MGIIKRIKKLFKKKIIVNETNLARIDTDLLFIPSFDELSENDQAMVLKYLKEVNIKDLDSIVDYTKNLTVEADFNSEFLLRLYYKLTDEETKKENSMLDDVYLSTIEINELNLCKNSLLKLRKEGILRIIALNKLYKQETSRKLTFAGIFGRLEKIKRMEELKSLEDLTNRVKISVKVIEQLIQVINISVDTNVLKVISEENFERISNYEDTSSKLNDLVLEITKNLKIFIPEYEKKFNFNSDNIEECLMTLSIARRLLDLYAYKNKDNALNIIEEIDEFYNKFPYETDDDKILENISIIESKYKLFKPYLSDNELVINALKKLYKIKFLILVRKNNCISQTKNKFELSCYEELASSMLEDILKGNNALFKIDPNFPQISNEMRNELNQMISSIINYSRYSLDPHSLLCDLERLNIIIALSNMYEMSYQERLHYFNEGEFEFKRPYAVSSHYTPYADRAKYNNCKNIYNSLKNLIKIFVNYEAYNHEKEMPYSFEMNIEMTKDGLKDKSILAKIYLDILQNSRLCILLPGVKNISDEFFSGRLSNLPVEKIVFSEGLNMFNVFNNCGYIKCLDFRKFCNIEENNAYNNSFRIKIEDCFKEQKYYGYFYPDCRHKKEVESIVLIMDYNFIKLFYLDEQLYKTYEDWYADSACKFDNGEFGDYESWCLNREIYEKLYTTNSKSESPLMLEEIYKSSGGKHVNLNLSRLIDVYGIKEFPLGKVKPFNIVVYKNGQSYNIDVARLFALRLKEDMTYPEMIKIYPLANTIIDEVNKREKCLVKHLQKQKKI